MSTKMRRIVLKNGVRLLLVPGNDSRAITAMVLVAAGAEAERPSEHGLAHFLEHMCFKGTKRRPSSRALIQEIEGLGAKTNAFTGKQSTGYWIKGQSRHAEQIIDLVADVYLNPIFPEADIENEKGVVIEEINMYDDMPQVQAEELFDKHLFGDTPEGRSIIGTKASVRHFTAPDVHTFRQTHYHARNTVVVIAGRIDPRSVIRCVTERFSTISTRATVDCARSFPALRKAPSPVSVLHKTSEQTHLVLGVPGLSLSHSDEPAQELLATLLGGSMSSRLFRILREEMGVCYYVSADAQPYRHYGTIAIRAGIPADRLSEVVSVVTRELARIANGDITVAELTLAKNVLSGGLALSLETSHALARFYGAQEVAHLPLKHPRAVIRDWAAVTPRDIARVAKRLFAPTQRRLAVVGPVTKTASLSRALLQDKP